MKRLENLRMMTDHALAGLEADEAMRQNIIRRASAGAGSVRRSVSVRKVAAVLACVAVLAASSVVFLNQPKTDFPMITSQPAGNSMTTSEPDLISRGSADIQLGIQKSGQASGSLWESGSNGTFPLVCVRGAYYRMTRDIPSAGRGSFLGTVEEFTTEPSLSDTGIISSNVLNAGTEIHAVSGMEGSMIVAEVNGSERLFQRVSFNGYALLNSETLENALRASGHVISIEWSGVGTIYNRDVCESLYRLLIQRAIQESNGSLSGNETLILTLDNGIRLQMVVRNDRLSACGVWSCPEFFEAFRDQLNM